MTNSNKKIKTFNRLLKDIGVYKVWYDERVKWIKSMTPLLVENKGMLYTIHIVVTAHAGTSIREIINNSFSWYSAKDEYLWEQLYDLVGAYSVRDIGYMKEDKYLNYIKKIKKGLGYG